MPALTIRNIPEATLERLRTRAARGHRSLNGEVLALFEEAVGAAPEGPVYMPPVPLPQKPTFGTKRPDERQVLRQFRACLVRGPYHDPAAGLESDFFQIS